MGDLTAVWAWLSHAQSALGWLFSLLVSVAVLVYARRDKGTDTRTKQEETSYSRLAADYARRDKDLADAQKKCGELEVKNAGLETENHALNAEMERRNGRWRYYGFEPEDGFNLFIELLKEKQHRDRPKGRG